MGRRAWGIAWAAIPALAALAYAPVLRIDFLGDDLWLLSQARASGLALQAFLPRTDWQFYRPLGTFFTWQLGWQLWGFNPLPYHLLGLLAHAGAALALGLFCATLTETRRIGWLTGALFAVFPLHIEAVGWLADQWDDWAFLFGALSLWIFTSWWRRTALGELIGRGFLSRELYVASVLCYAAGLFTKESLITFVPLFALSAWVVTPRIRAKTLLKLFFVLLPFCGVLSLNLAVRLSVWGNIGGYPLTRTDYGNFFWDTLIGYTHVILSPINTLQFGQTVAQVVGALTSAAILCGLVLYGRSQRRLLLFSASWLALTLVPVLNLGVNPANLESNRFLYLPTAGYCIGVAALIHSAIRSARREASVAVAFAGVGTLLALSIVTCWIQLLPWQTVSAQATVYHDELLRLIPAPSYPRPGGMTWYIKNQPHFVYGVDVLNLGFSYRRYFIANGDVATTEPVANASDLPLVSDPGEAFVVGFRYDAATSRYHVAQVSGITGASQPPTSSEVGDHSVLWDFTKCDPVAIAAWEPVKAQTSCRVNNGLALQPSTSDPQLANPNISVNLAGSGARFLRIRTSVQYGAFSDSNPSIEAVGEWFWEAPGAGWSPEHSTRLRLKRDGTAHVYWTFIPITATGPVLHGLRFDPINVQLSARIQWMMMDLVK